jgi:hypothetical protein
MQIHVRQSHEPRCTVTWGTQMRCYEQHYRQHRRSHDPSRTTQRFLSHVRTTKYITTKNVKKDRSPPLYFFHSCPYVTSNPCGYFALVPVFRTSSVLSLARRCILPIASLPSFTFPSKIIPLYFYNVVFHYIPYWMKQCVLRLHIPKGEVTRCNLFGAHPSIGLFSLF